MTVRWYHASLLLCLSTASSVMAGSTLMDASGNLRVNSLPETDTAVVAFVSSPGSSDLVADSSDILSYDGSLVCRGATLSDDNAVALGTSSLVAGAIVLDGISVGDLEAGLRDSRHGKTLMAIFRARAANKESKMQQTLILPIKADELPMAPEKIANEVMALFAAASVQSGSNASFNDFYELKIATYSDPSEIQSMATDSVSTTESTGSLSEALTEAYSKVKSLSATDGDAVPSVSDALVKVGNVYSKQSLTVRAKLASWKARVARGLLVDGFGNEAEALLEKVLKTFDTETIVAAGMSMAGAYRREQRTKLQTLLETGIQDIFEGQIQNLEKTTLKRLNAQLLKTVNEPAESVMDSNAASLRNEAFAFETAADDLEVPSLSLTKTKAVRDVTAKLNDAVMSFPDSAAAKIKRTRKVTRAVKKDKKPGQGIVDFGLDLVAVLRPDGFGSLQGFAGYQLGGNSITVGVHNDADDPQTIAQFGGVRPPLLRVQPKLRLDVEL